jgi:hypothetical protein
MPGPEDRRAQLLRVAAAYGVTDTDRLRKLALIAEHRPAIRPILIAEWTRESVLALAADHRQECASDACRTCVGISNLIAMQLASLDADSNDTFQSIVGTLE